MTTKIIGIKNFRENITKLWKEAKKKNIRFIVMNHSEPILEVKSISEKELRTAKLQSDIAEAREQYKRGEFYSNEEIMKEFGL